MLESRNSLKSSQFLSQARLHDEHIQIWVEKLQKQFKLKEQQSEFLFYNLFILYMVSDTRIQVELHTLKIRLNFRFEHTDMHAFKSAIIFCKIRWHGDKRD